METGPDPRRPTSPDKKREPSVKTLYLLRHAKSSWDDLTLPDYERPLAPRGRKAAPRIGRFLSREGWLPQRVLCSGARRARQTWDLVSSVLEEEIPAEIRPDIYHADVGALLQLIQTLPSSEASALLVGHNPTMEDLARILAGSSQEKALRMMESKYPTGGLAVLDFPGDAWSGVRPGSGHLRAFVRPKDLKRGKGSR